MLKQLKSLALARQGLTSSTPFGLGIDGARRAIEHLGYLQIDTLSVVERAHHHILWTRVPDYEVSYLNSLLRDKHVFEHWFHAASYLPMCDYRFVLPQMTAIRRGANRYYNNVDEHLMREILDRVRIDGPLQVRDIQSNNVEGGGSWWNRGPGRRALDKLFMQGDLMVRERNGMAKVYDLAERLLPTNLDLREPTLAEYAKYLLDNTLRAHGVVTWKQLLHLKTDKPLKEKMKQLLADRVDAGAIIAINDAQLPEMFVEPQALEQTISVPANQIRLLSPFDNSVIHRLRLSQLFEFDYRMECYVPAAKRLFGYFCLPILFGDCFVGQVDCKAHRSEKRFELLSVYVDKSLMTNSDFQLGFIEAAQQLAKFNGCSIVTVRDLPLNSWLKGLFL